MIKLRYAVAILFPGLGTPLGIWAYVKRRICIYVYICTSRYLHTHTHTSRLEDTSETQTSLGACTFQRCVSLRAMCKSPRVRFISSPFFFFFLDVYGKYGFKLASDCSSYYTHTQIYLCSGACTLQRCLSLRAACGPTLGRAVATRPRRFADSSKITIITIILEQ
ncbi:hypothetical protein T492DRAFT_271630 [Pavlovales sp. CCMP2436]|nr:hypothetical protein T492DRAFT_271630 [Pavlovales sp. CCMP2436]